MGTSTTAGEAGEASRAQDVTLRAVTVMIGIVVGLTFLFGFGNVLDLGLRLGVPIWVAPLVAPAVDLPVLGLLLAIVAPGIVLTSAHQAKADVRQVPKYSSRTDQPAWTAGHLEQQIA